MLVLNWHNQNPNITTAENQNCYYSDRVEKSESINLVICDRNACHHNCSLYTYTYWHIKENYVSEKLCIPSTASNILYYYM